ncbi:hypothetical protein [Corynebacterium sp. HS2168-gen11]|uniref:hypothetical protein n=1 Tax=Corynebacterium sp. HS2168-gen11 TaxID=2974027 RepID=UPI00216B4E06|nr:hypothetical protein [Corynebacterium sp. HS2168-gen11]MCS4535476.1 hypothetical protein [Corynebacterium sp. HS2168-gen11]
MKPAISRTIGVIGCIALATTTPIAQAQDAVTDVTTVLSWTNPAVRTEATSPAVSLTLSGIPSTLELNQPLPLTLTLDNTADAEISDLLIVAQHADPVSTVSQGRFLLAAPESAFTYYAETELIDQPLQAHQSSTHRLSIQTNPQLPGSFSFHQPGTYPILIGVQNATTGEHYASQRFLITVHDPQAALDDATVTNPEPLLDDAPAPAPLPALSLLYPISAPVDLVAGETGETDALLLTSTDLEQSLRNGGRLHSLLDDYRTATLASPKLQHATCLAFDPALLSAVQRMAQHGYTVTQHRPSSVSKKQRLRDSWSFTRREPVGEVFPPSQAAAQWLRTTEELAQQNGCVVALPWANADINAVAATGNTWLLREAVSESARVVGDILHVPPIPNLVVPATGYITEATAPLLADVFSPTPTEQLWDTAESLTSPGEIITLITDNSSWGAPQAGRFTTLGTGIRGVTYQGSVNATLAEAAEAPITPGYSNYAHRYDLRKDAPHARMTTAAASIHLALREQQAVDPQQPVLLNLPVTLQHRSALLDTISQILESQTALPISLPEYLQPTPEQQEAVRLATDTTTIQDAHRFGAPFDDPAEIPSADILAVQHQATQIDNLTHLMIHDPAINLSPYAYTAPLRHALLHILSTSGRQSMLTAADTNATAHRRLQEQEAVLQQLRNSVSLVPPGNVYTRISDSSPLLIVAQNGLPLPVDARLMHTGPAGSDITAPDPLFIPAKGSITIQMTARLANTSHRTDLHLWLATRNQAAISDPVTIGVQTRSGLMGPSGSAAMVLGVLVSALIGRVILRKKRRQAKAGAYRRA